MGTAVASPPSALVTDAYGNVVTGTTVTFAVTGGGGSGSTLTPTTNASGIATVGSWTLGTAAGTNTMTATAAGLTGSPLTYTATGTAGAATTVSKSVGDNQTALPGAAVTTPPAVLVTDTYGNPKSGIAVTFAVASGGGSATGTAATTDASGLATVGSWTLGASVGANTLTATVSGLTAVTFTANALNTNIIAVNGGNNQTATVHTAVATAPSVLVKDTNGNVLSGATVTFAVAVGGGSVTGASATTNGSGIATVGSWTLGNAVGSNSLTATVTVSAITSSVTFTATGTVGAASAIAKSAGDSQSATVATAVATVPTVLVTDAYNNPVSGVTVAFAASGNGSVGAASASTNASGIASVGRWTLTTTPGANALTATASGLGGSPLTFSATAVVGAPSSLVKAAGDNQSATVGTTVGTPPRVRVVDAQGNGLAGVAVTFATASGSVTGGSASTDGSGYATVTSWTLGTTAGSQTLTATVSGLTAATFTATAGAAAASQVTLVAGDGQTAAAGSAVATVPQVKVADSYGNAVANVTVTFTVTAGNGAVGASSATTDAAGLASPGSWTLGSGAGTNTLDATVTGLTPVTFTATATVDAASAPFVARIITVAPGGTYAPKNVVAAWIETAAGAFVKTIGDWSAERRVSLTGWLAKAGSADTDGIMGATRTGHSEVLTVTWDLKAKNGTATVADGGYVLRFEVADSNPGGSNLTASVPFTLSGGTVAAVAATTLASGAEVAINAPLASTAASGNDQSGCGIGSVNALIGLLGLVLVLGLRRRRS